MPLPQIINDITKDGVLYAVVLTEACAVDKTLNIHVLQGKNPKGNILSYFVALIVLITKCENVDLELILHFIVFY